MLRRASKLQIVSQPLLSAICREITAADLEPIVDLLTHGYAKRDRGFWARRLKRLSQHSSLAGFPKYGFLLEVDGRVVGTIFTIFSTVMIGPTQRTRCYLSSWYVEPAFRGWATILAKRALSFKDVTYLNVTPTEDVRSLLRAQGYALFSEGRFAFAPALAGTSEAAKVALFSAGPPHADGLEAFEVELLSRHADYGCISLTCATANARHPFVFQKGYRARIIPVARLVYCRDIEDVQRFAGLLGRFLLARGYAIVLLDTDQPIRGLVGIHSKKYPMFFKGPDRPRLGDLAYSPRVIFDF
jgi:hypothetical protein